MSEIGDRLNALYYRCHTPVDELSKDHHDSLCEARHVTLKLLARVSSLEGALRLDDDDFFARVIKASTNCKA
jgi:hypothetical protein